MEYVLLNLWKYSLESYINKHIKKCFITQTKWMNDPFENLSDWMSDSELLYNSRIVLRI